MSALSITFGETQLKAHHLASQNMQSQVVQINLVALEKELK